MMNTHLGRVARKVEGGKDPPIKLGADVLVEHSRGSPLLTKQDRLTWPILGVDAAGHTARMRQRWPLH